MKKLIFSLALVITTAYAFIWSYYNLIDNIKERRTKEAQSYLFQNQAIDDLQSKHPKSLDEIKEYDKKTWHSIKQKEVKL